VLAACVVMAALAGTGAAEEKPAGPLERADLDQRIEKLLRDVINHGADLYNSGDQQGCYRLYEGSVLTLRALLDHHPELQKDIDQALANARNDANPAQRAFTLRAVIDRVRNTTYAGGAVPSVDPSIKFGQGATLWQRLGEEKGVRAIVDDFVDAALIDEKVDFSRGGKYKIQTAHLKEQFVNLASSVSEGRYKYEGKSMLAAHKGMDITDAQFDAFVGHMRTALEKCEKLGLDHADTNKVMNAVEAKRNDIVGK
jgi:truncated hemoglobin YjbI